MITETEERKPERVQCTRTRACGWIGTTADYRWVPKDSRSLLATCPRCGNANFHTPDRLTTQQEELINAVEKACEEFDPKRVPFGATTDIVRWHFRKLWDNTMVLNRLNKLAITGHVVKEKDERGRTRWRLPTPKTDGTQDQ